MFLVFRLSPTTHMLSNRLFIIRKTPPPWPLVYNTTIYYILYIIIIIIIYILQIHELAWNFAA